MSGPFYKSVRLKTGELLACVLDDDFTLESLENKKYITLHDPVIYDSFKFLDPKSDQIVDTTTMTPFVGVTSDRNVVIVADQIISINSLRDSARDRYNRFVRQLDAYNIAGDIVNHPGVDVDPINEEELRLQELLNMPTDNILH